MKRRLDLPFRFDNFQPFSFFLFSECNWTECARRMNGYQEKWRENESWLWRSLQNWSPVRAVQELVFQVEKVASSSRTKVFQLVARKVTSSSLTWDQAQFERFSGSNGYRWNWASLFVSSCPPECNFQSETKIEPDLRLVRAVLYRSIPVCGSKSISRRKTEKGHEFEPYYSIPACGSKITTKKTPKKVTSLWLEKYHEEKAEKKDRQFEHIPACGLKCVAMQKVE